MAQLAQPEPELLSIMAARATLGDLSRSRIYELMDAGEIESVKIGRRRMITRESIRKLIERSRKKVA